MSRNTRSHRRARLVLGIALTSLIVGSFAWAPPASADTITVTTFEDEYGDGAACSLREASVAANTDAPFGGCSAGNGPDIISLSAGVYVLSIVGECPRAEDSAAFGFPQTCPDENFSRNGDIDFDDLDDDKDDDPGITVQGVGMNASIIDGNGGTVRERVFDVRDGDAMFADLTVRHGNGLPFGQRGGGIFGHTNPDETLTILRSSVHANKAACRGGGVAAGSGTDLVVTDSEISNNEVELTQCSQGDPAVPVADGGGIYASGPYAIQGSTISDNYAFQLGGGVYAPNGFFGGTITNSVISGNEVTGSQEDSSLDQGAGGGLYISPYNNLVRSSGELQSPVSIVDTTVAKNHAGNAGGGLFISCCGIIDVLESTFDNNTAFVGGGVFNESQSENSAYLTNVTVSSNYAFAGGGIFNSIGDMYLNHVTVYRNVAEEVGGGVYDESGFTLYYRNSIIAGNTYEDCGGSGESQGYNFLGDGSCSSDVPRGINGGGTDIIPTNGPIDPRLAPLRDNGGPTKTHELLPSTEGNPTPIDNAFTDGGCEVETDQRGLIRPTGNACDIGAYEVGSLDEEDDDGDDVGGVVIDKPELCRKQNPTIVGTLGPDRIVGTSGPDIIQGLDARDVILGGGGDDIICGSLGDDVLKGQGGDDWTKGLRGDDTDRGGPGTDKCVRGPGEDKYFSCENIPANK